MRLHYFFTFLLVSSFILSVNSCCYAGKGKKGVNNNSEPSRKWPVRNSTKFRMLQGFKRNSGQSNEFCSSPDDSRRRTMPVQAFLKEKELDTRMRRSSMPEKLEKPLWYSEECVTRLMSYKGKSPEEVLRMQLESSDWYTRNSARCFKAFNMLDSAPRDAKAYIKMAHEEGFPAATFEFVKMALGKGKLEKAKELLELTCEYTIDCEREYDDQTHSVLIKSIRTYVRKNPALELILQRFKSTPLFQEKGEKREEIVLNKILIQLYGEDEEDPITGLDLSSKDLTLTQSFKHKDNNQKEDSDSDSDPFADFSDDDSKE